MPKILEKGGEPVLCEVCRDEITVGGAYTTVPSKDRARHYHEACMPPEVREHLQSNRIEKGVDGPKPL